jgi:trehalose transport system permease protein
VACATTIAAVVVAAPAAYVVARMPPGPRYTLLVGLLITRMLPEFAVGVSVATHFARLGLVDSYLGLLLAHLITALPFTAWILVGTFEGISKELEEAAAVDGASRPAMLARVILPAAAPGVAVAALFVWLYSWNEFLYARLLTTSQNTLPLQVFQAVDRGTRQQMATVAAVLVLPIGLAIWVLQRHLRPGALAGALKG